MPGKLVKNVICYTIFHFLVYLGPEFTCSDNGGEWQHFTKAGPGMVGLLKTVTGINTVQACSLICIKTSRCHAFNNSAEDVCSLLDYYPIPSESVVVEEYYQLHCV